MFFQSKLSGKKFSVVCIIKFPLVGRDHQRIFKKAQSWFLEKIADIYTADQHKTQRTPAVIRKKRPSHCSCLISVSVTNVLKKSSLGKRGFAWLTIQVRVHHRGEVEAGTLHMIGTVRSREDKCLDLCLLAFSSYSVLTPFSPSA